MANDLFPVATYRPAPRTTPNPRPKADPAPIAPDPAANGVTWYTLQDGSMIPGEGTYVDIVAQNIEEIIICANNIDSIIQAVDANVQAQDAANRAAASATAAANSASAANGSASLASASASAAQTSATAASSSQTASAASAAAALASQNAAATSATNASTSATNAATSATDANNSWVTFNKMWYGPYASAPALDPFGGAPNAGDVYFDTTQNAVQVRGNSAWQTVVSGVTSVAGKSGVVTLVHNDISDWDASLAPYATLGSPVFTGSPSLPAGTVAVTAAPGDNDTSIATTAFVMGAVAGLPAYAPLASPVFTGNPTAPTPAPGDADTSIATTAFVTTALVPYAPLAAPVFTGDARAVTPAVGDADTSIATTAFVAAAVAPALNDVGRNLVHNGQFNVAQRGAGPFTTNTYTLDRWTAYAQLDAVSITQQTLTDADRTAIGDEAAGYAFQNTFTGNAGASAFNKNAQPIENLRRLSGKTVTVSFYAKAVAGTPKLGVNIEQYFGSGGSPSASAWVQATGNAVTLSTTWARYTMTFVVSSLLGKTVGTNGDNSTNLVFFYSSGATNNVTAGSIGVQSGTINLWGVQLEIGSTATPLAKRDPADELALCQRFYTTGVTGILGNLPAGNALGLVVAFPVRMRAAPSITLGALTASINISGAPSSDTASGDGFRFYVTSTASGATQATGPYIASADL